LLNANRKDSDFRFFVTHDSSTWETTNATDPPTMDLQGGHDDWTYVSRRGSSGRGGRRIQETQQASATGPRGRSRAQGTNPGTNANRTLLGPKTRYKQMTFEETEQRRRSRSHSRDNPVPTPGRYASPDPPQPSPPVDDSWASMVEDSLHSRSHPHPRIHPRPPPSDPLSSPPQQSPSPSL
jgi:hypothetical protein